MKKLTNYTPGPRGITLKSGEVVWIKPGQSVELDPSEIVTKPDLGSKPSADQDGDDDLSALQSQVSDLTKQVETLTAENKGLAKDKSDLTKQVETLTKPSK